MGCQLRVPLADAAMVRFADMQPSRRFRARKGQRHLPGCWWSATDGRHVGYESWLERDEAMWLDWDRAVTGIASQPFRLWWTAGQGEVPSHVPDYFAERGDDPPVVVDCRPADRRRPRDMAAFEATRRACDLVDWEYRLVGALDPVATANLRWLSGYRHPRYGVPPVAAALWAAFAEPGWGRTAAG